MFWNQYIYRLRVSVRTWDTLFWTWVFPLLLATLFFFAFSRLDSADAFAPIPAAVVADEAYQADPAFSGTLDAVSAEGEGRLLLLTPGRLRAGGRRSAGQGGRHRLLSPGRAGRPLPDRQGRTA